MYVEGLVHITELGGDYFKFDETRQELRGERTGIRYNVGARVRVQVSRVDLDGRKIDFRWVQEDGSTALDKPLRGKKLPSGAANVSVPDKSAKAKDRGAKGGFHAGTKSSSQALKTSAKKNTAKVQKNSKNRH
jgi:ribonuclease R